MEYIKTPNSKAAMNIPHKVMIAVRKESMRSYGKRYAHRIENNIHERQAKRPAVSFAFIFSSGDTVLTLCNLLILLLYQLFLM